MSSENKPKEKKLQENKRRTTGRHFDIPSEDLSLKVKERKLKTFIPDDMESLNEVPESITAGERLPHISEYSGISLEALPLRGMKTFIYSAGLLLTILFGWEVFSVINSLLEIHWLLAWVFAGLVLLVLLLSLRVTWSFFKDRETIESLESLQKHSQHLSEVNDLGRAKELISEFNLFYLKKPQHVSFQRCLEQLPDYSNDREVVAHIERIFLRPLDKEALRRVSNYSLQTATAVAVSPWASLDMLLSLWRSIKMIDDVAQVYGMRPSLFNRYKLLKLVTHQLVFVAASEVVIDQVIEEFGSSTLASMAGARLGQGLGAGIYTAKIGVATMQVCRPIAFTSESKPKIKVLLSLIVNRLKSMMFK
jgi:putative membrane protein